MAAFRYEKSLIGSRSTQEIRLIALQPGEGDSQVECTLQYVSLVSDPDYEAISYTWGGQKPSKPILCDGLELNITPNLHDALRHFRSPAALVFLWADAICINQEDLGEKNEQVPLMGMIYSKAKKVKIWLGDEEETTLQVPKLIAKLNSLAKHYSQKLSVPLTDLMSLDSSSWSGIMDELQDNKDTTDWAPLVSFFQNAWFRRAWIVQEVSLAKGRAWLHCGETIIWWPDVAQAILFMLHSGINALATLSQSISEFLTCYRLASLARITAMLMNPSEADDGAFDLLWILYANMGSLATNPLDKIYAFLSLAKKDNLVIPDYQLSAAKCYQQVSEICMEVYPTLPIFVAAGLRPPHPTQTPDLPSWVVDWNYEEPDNLDNIIYYHEICKSGAEGDYNAGLTNLYSPSYKVNGNILSLEGFLLDQVTEFTIPTMGIHESFTLGHLSLEQKGVLATARWHEVAKMFGQSLDGTYHFTGESFSDALGSTLYRGDVPEDFRPNLHRGFKDVFKIARLYSVIKNSPLGSTKLGLSAALKIARLLYMFMLDSKSMTSVFTSTFGMAHKSLFKTKTGLVGVVWSTQVQAGDYIALIKGGMVPLMLRPCGDGRFNLVGNTYLHGAMKGEMFDIDKCRELCIV
ncbi:unnamed protein product [Clonostachys rosea f. rosea IK726]|uniref:Heterokaryon incompatibility domain-containing protein n=2 Tax=Bionectria ochroleuca TaxID=29856 RepID=A0A0B7JMS9_BIOOC|nr:unnamed protein product [Clonostachys rosea f. rosea IK726]